MWLALPAGRASCHSGRDVTLRRLAESRSMRLLPVCAFAVLVSSMSMPPRAAVQSPPLTAPGARVGSVMAYDSTRRQTVLFGGREMNARGETSYPNDLWSWDGTTWRQLTAGNDAPPGREYPHMAFDPARGRIVVQGGRTERGPKTTVLRDTWEWDGTRWHDRGEGPPYLHSGFVYHAALKKIVLCGGGSVVDGSMRLSTDVWQWDGTRWTALSTDGPANQPLNGVAYDERGNRLLAVLGAAPGTSPTHAPSEVWSWTPGGWTRLEQGPSFSPIQPMTGTEHGGILLLLSDATWVRGADAWTRHTPASAPGARGGPAMAYDAHRRRTVLFGGLGAGRPRGDVWEWDGSAWTRLRD